MLSPICLLSVSLIQEVSLFQGSPREERRRLFELEQGPARLTPLGERLVGLAAW